MSGYEGLLTFCTLVTITWRNISLRASFPGRSPAWREKEGQFATTSLELEFHPQFPCGSPSTKLSVFRQLARSRNECECEQQVPRVMTPLLMSYPPIGISFRLFRCRYSNSRDVVAASPSFSRPADRASRELARRLCCTA